MQHCLDFVDMCKKLHTEKKRANINIYSWDDEQGFRGTKFTSTKTWDNMYLPRDLKKSIIDDVETFVHSEARYVDLGIQYQCNYLLWGKPGVGKTSFAKVLANQLRRDIYVIDLQTIIKDETLRTVFRALPDNDAPIIILIEDIDCVNFTHDRESTEPDKENFVIEGC